MSSKAPVFEPVDSFAYHSAFTYMDVVQIDGGDLLGTVIGLAFYPSSRVLVLVAWINNGDHKEVWLDSERLTLITRRAHT